MTVINTYDFQISHPEKFKQLAVKDMPEFARFCLRSVPIFKMALRRFNSANTKKKRI